MYRWVAIACAAALVASCGGSALVGSSPSPTPSPAPGVFIPAAAVLYGRIAQERPGECYPLDEAARFSLLDLSMYLAQRTARWCGTPDPPLDALRARNPNSVILLYRMSPIELNWTEDRRFPVSGREYFDQLRQSHGIGSADPWFEPGERTRDYLVDISYPQYVAMALGNANWRRYWIEQGYEDMWGRNPVVDARGASGVFVDGAPASPPSGFCPMSGWDIQTGRCTVGQDYLDRYWDNNGTVRRDLWVADMFAFIREAVLWYRGRGLQMMFNAWTLGSNYVDLLNQVGGHAMEECGFVCYNRFPPDPGQWLTRLQNLQRATNFAILNTNAIVAPGSGRSRMDAVIWNGMRGWDVLWFAMTSFLLGYEPNRRNGYFHFTVRTGSGNSAGYYRDTFWFDEYDPRYLHLGRPRGPARQLSTGVWEREFDRGWVWVNPSGSSPRVQVPAGRRARVLNHENFRNPSAVTPVAEFQLEPWRGVVGLRE